MNLNYDINYKIYYKYVKVFNKEYGNRSIFGYFIEKRLNISIFDNANRLNDNILNDMFIVI